jgi:hypothetical protein
MDDVVAVEVRLADGTSRYFVTWGRIQEPVDPGPLCELVLHAAPNFALGGKPVGAHLCHTLRDAADSGDAPYFYECFLGFCRTPIPTGDDYEQWRAAKAEAMSQGMEIAYCGNPAARS